MRRAKIVCTLGPASSDAAMIDALVEAGMDCARLNFSHGTHESHRRVAELVRKSAARAGRPVALLADLCGPKIRTGLFAAGPVELTPDRPFTLTTRDTPGDADHVSVTYSGLPEDVQPGDDILLDDGLLRLRVAAVEGPDIRCDVIVGGTLSGGKGINIPGRALSTAAMTPKDEDDLAFAVGTLGVEFVALSFVRTADDVRMAQRLAGGTPIIAKLEKPEAIRSLAEIADVAEGAMVARGDLGVELGAEKVPLVQKRIIREVNSRGKLVITATQMLDSMIRNPTPTRAEAADVANAVLDGTDALMLSGETAAGRYPLEAVRMMDRIIREVESAWLLEDRVVRDVSLMEDWGFATAAAKAAALMSYALPLKAILVFTRDGRTANLLSEYRPRAPIVAVTPKRQVAARLALEWGVIPRVEVPPDNLSETMRIASGLLAREGLCHEGDAFAVVMGWPPEEGTNTVKLHRM
ncbi:MAG: pyruvate kinase [Deltaproteobacteria bacterium]|nr:pyruvate kinase [Deltaproteobacteria bacterium]